MKIKAQNLNHHLQTTLAKVYLVFGAELLLVEKTCAQIREAARQRGFSERIRFDIDATFDWQALTVEIANTPLFAEKRMIECQLQKMNKSGADALSAIIPTLSAETVMIFKADKLSAAEQKSRWFKMMDEGGVVVQHFEMNRTRLVGWIFNALAEHGLAADKAVAELIAEHTEGNLLAAEQEIQKLKLAGGGRIDLETYQRQISQQSRYNIYALTDAALAGNASSVVKILDHLADEDFPLLIFYLHRQIKILIAMAIEKKHRPMAELMRKNNIWQSRQNAVAVALKNHRYQNLQRFLLALGRIDRSFKGMDEQNPKNALRTLLINISGRQGWI